MSPLLIFHILLVSSSCLIFLFSFILSILFLLQEYQLKRKKLWKISRHFPALNQLDQLHYKTLRVGFLFLTLGIISGAVWAKQMKGVFFFHDPKQLWAIISWLIYALFFQMRFSSLAKGRRGVLLSILGFIVVMFTFLEVHHS